MHLFTAQFAKPAAFADESNGAAGTYILEPLLPRGQIIPRVGRQIFGNAVDGQAFLSNH